MVNEVGKIIRNTLLTHGAVLLPSVGTLYVVRKGSILVGKGRVAAPEYRIEYASNREATSIVDAIAKCASIDEKGAEDIYMLWLDKARKDGVVEIFSVGVLKNKSFTANEELINGINLNKGNIISITKQRRRSGRVALYIAAAAAIIAIAVGAYIFVFASKGEQKTSAPHTDAVPMIAESEVNMPDNSATLSISTDSLHKVVDNTEIEPIICEDFIVVDNRPWIERDDIKHYVIYGSYTRKRNAEREAAHINSRGLDGVVSKTIIRGKMYSVVIYGGDTIEECEAFIAEHKSEFPQAWVYSIEES